MPTSFPELTNMANTILQEELRILRMEKSFRIIMMGPLVSVPTAVMKQYDQKQHGK